MPFLDRHWWLRIPIALLPLGAVLLIVAYALRNPSEAVRDPLFGIGCAGIGVLILLVFAFFFIRGIGSARYRSERRRVAISDNRDAILLADGAATQSDTELPTTPFTGTFPLTHWDHPALARLRVILSLSLFAITAITVVLTYILDNQRNQTVPLAIIYIAFFVLAAVTHLWHTIVTRPYIRSYRSPRSIVADTMGILWQPIVGRERTIRWDEMRLLEVASFNATPFTSNQTIMRRRYTLYTSHSAIWWTDPGNLHLPPSGSYAQLLALIKARTGLDPRTFDTDLRAPAYLQATTELPAPAPDLEGDVAYLLAFPLPSRRGRPIAGFFGILLTTPSVLAGIWTLSKFGVVTLPPLMFAATAWLHAIPAFFLLLGGIIGLPLLIGALHSTPVRRLHGIRVDHTGISTYPPRTSISIAWSDIAAIECETFGPAKWYIAHSAIGEVNIMWGDPRKGRTAPTALVTALGFTPISSDELVALIMRITNKPLTSYASQPSTSGAAHAVY